MGGEFQQKWVNFLIRQRAEDVTTRIVRRVLDEYYN